MNISGNTILITGGTSGIGRALAEAFHKQGNQVIVTGRRRNLLEQVTAANPGMKAAVLDVQDSNALARFAESAPRDYPGLNVLINNAGIMVPENLHQPDDSTIASTIETNLLAPIRLTLALLPALQKQPRAAVINVSSGLAFVPMAITPTYCATKAAIHSWTQSLRHQLKAAPVQVVELIPPYVQTDLMGEHQRTDPRAMPLRDFIDEVMEILRTQPDAQEICVKRVYPLRFAAEQGSYDQVFAGLNGDAARPRSSH
ncbi:MAG TPA: SDR family oxidoreductase [Acidobacteriaceae bacterium]|nr:SDR family oxidoreductase [Acidobacteriaceae bacterium]